MLTRVLVDSREPETITRQSFGAQVRVIELECGDAWAFTDTQEVLIFERKTPHDLFASIKDGRLFQQVSAMREQSDWVYLVITGLIGCTPTGYVTVNGVDTRWQWQAVQGVLLEVQERGVGVLWADHDGKFGEVIQAVAKRDRVSTKPVMPRVDTQRVTPDEKILMALPGIGYERARNLLDVFSYSPILALQWLTDQKALGDVDNIGKATKRNVRRALAMTDDMELCIVTADRDIGVHAVVQVDVDDPLALSQIAL